MQFDSKPIDFHQLAKPANLSNSAVLRMLEEEEARGRGQAFQDKLQNEIKCLNTKPNRRPPEWPPASTLARPVRWILAPTESAPVKKGLKRVAWPPPQNEAEFLVEEPAPVYAQAPVSLQSLPGQGTAPAPSQTSQNYRPVPAPTQPLQSYRPAAAPAFSPPPTTITLRASPPISQPAFPVYASQPITATVRGGARSRGDQKWPPENVKQQAEAENEARIALAKGPAFRPRRQQKDYSNFFAQHALNSTYPGYRAPPGTQHYIEEGTSNL